MAQRVTTQLVDDLNGDTIADGTGKTLQFSFDGNHYAIDLSDDNADALREAFSDYVAAARKVSGGRQGGTNGGSTAKRGNSDELTKIREWANIQTWPHQPGRPRRVRRRALTPSSYETAAHSSSGRLFALPADPASSAH